MCAAPNNIYIYIFNANYYSFRGIYIYIIKGTRMFFVDFDSLQQKYYSAATNVLESILVEVDVDIYKVDNLIEDK